MPQNRELASILVEPEHRPDVCARGKIATDKVRGAAETGRPVKRTIRAFDQSARRVCAIRSGELLQQLKSSTIRGDSKNDAVVIRPAATAGSCSVKKPIARFQELRLWIRAVCTREMLEHGEICSAFIEAKHRAKPEVSALFGHSIKRAIAALDHRRKWPAPVIRRRAETLE